MLSDGGRTGRPRKEVIAPRAFAYRVDRPEEDIHFLVGHSYDRPIASRGAGTLTLTDTNEALLLEILIANEMREVGYVRDFLAGFSAGLILGLSPGFRIPPTRVEPDAEEIEEEPNDGQPDEDGQPQRGALIRTVKSALLYEISAVTRPA
ncbi:MAG: HK97 family phage prohead protease [Paracoccaceae bacterium]|nr:HK97 family phage prohead protease [Paracoccaceae bacterium]